MILKGQNKYLPVQHELVDIYDVEAVFSMG
jgi:hypothetical protein